MKMEDLKRPTIYVLVGLPGSGKSTWIRNKEDAENFVIVSSDDEIDAYAKSVGKTYSEVFDSQIKSATKMMNAKFDDAIAQHKNIIWDQTNMTSKKRKAILSRVPNVYKKVAVVFQVDDNELADRLKYRAEKEGKYIPQHVLNSMRVSFEMPSRSEGFHHIETV